MPFFILSFWIITFGASAIEKLADFKGTRLWLETYLEKTPFRKWVGGLLIFVLLAEIVATFCCIMGLVYWFQHISDIKNSYSETISFRIFSEIGLSVGIFTLLCFLVGQRFAKDYEGARGMTIYIFAGIVSFYLLEHLI